MRQSSGAFAVITRDDDGIAQWLSQWNSGWKAYHLVGGHRHSDESFRQCVIREIEEELGLELETDYDLRTKPSRHLEYADWSERARQMTQYEMEVFEAYLKPHSYRQIDRDPSNRWLTQSEIEAHVTRDGLPVSATFLRFLGLAEGVPARRRRNLR